MSQKTHSLSGIAISELYTDGVAGDSYTEKLKRYLFFIYSFKEMIIIHFDTFSINIWYESKWVLQLHVLIFVINVLIST